LYFPLMLVSSAYIPLNVLFVTVAFMCRDDNSKLKLDAAAPYALPSIIIGDALPPADAALLKAILAN
jgi:hypothetical protein